MEQTLPGFDRITADPAELGGQPCIRGYRFSVEHALAPLRRSCYMSLTWREAVRQQLDRMTERGRRPHPVT